MTASGLAAHYGWPDSTIDADSCESKKAKAALTKARRELREQDELARESQSEAREEAEIYDRDQREMRAEERGESLVYFTGESLQEAADELGMPEDSETARLYHEGKLDKAEASRRAQKIIHRHEHTHYDELLARGVDRDTAREIIYVNASPVARREGDA